MSNTQAKTSEEVLFKEIDVIQDIIKRMADNSFNIKKWTITLIGAILLFKQNAISPVYGIVPVLFFWIMDTKYLQLERMYIQLQNDKVKARTNNDLIGSYDFNPHKASKKADYFDVMFSWSQSLLYVSFISLLIIVAT